MKKQYARSRDFSLGFSLVEVLVALVVMSVGMLGIASLYVVSIQSGKSAVSRMQAVSLAADLADRIRVNAQAGATYNTSAANSTADKGSDKGCIGGSADCSGEDMALTDLSQWSAALQTALPGGTIGAVTYPRGTVELTVGTPNTYVITVSWLEPGQTTTPLSYVLRMQL
jgi:type IV pilus assembly protein PilV